MTIPLDDTTYLSIKESYLAKRALRIILNQKIDKLMFDLQNLEILYREASTQEDLLQDELDKRRIYESKETYQKI